jgi:hypothetical protein
MPPYSKLNYLTFELKLNHTKALIVSILISSIWLYIGTAVSKYSLTETLPLYLVQFVLTYIAIINILNSDLISSLTEGPNILSLLALHVLLYYCIANIFPAIIPEQRTYFSQMMNKIPESDVGYYFLSSVAAVVFLVATVLGYYACNSLFKNFSVHRSRLNSFSNVPWLPSYQTSLLFSSVLMICIIYATIMYGWKTGTILTDENIIEFTFFEKLTFHGSIYFLPVPPILGSSAYIQANSLKQKKYALWLFGLSCLVTLLCLIIWRQRSTAMIAVSLSICLLGYTNTIPWKKLILPIILSVVIAYSLVTIVRESALPALISMSGDLSGTSAAEMISAIQPESNDMGILSSFLNDMSYRTAGLEGVAAIIMAQERGNIELMMGRVTFAGFKKSLPMSLRGENTFDDRIKTAPSFYGVFDEGDWVTTILAEQVMDYGIFILFLPSFVIGFLLCAIDALLYYMGSMPSCDSLLVIRISWLLYIISNGGCLSDLTLNFIKATIGYTFMLLIIGYIYNYKNFRKYKPTRG